jgi:hypothetical protein
MAVIVRLDRYLIEVNDKVVRATPEQEEQLRAMSDEQVERFLTALGMKS